MKTDIQTFKTVTGLVLIAIMITGLTVTTLHTLSGTRAAVEGVLNNR